ncbi:MAG: sulfurtransferase TusA family protein [Anaerolineaceae bacterium]|nr:sulfurtransferase TusA family protein [Anaerolineaceae bacterium]
MDFKPNKTIDECGEVCPVPDVDTKRALAKMKPGEILEVLIDYPLSKERIPATVERMGHEVVLVEETGPSAWRILIKVK